MRKIYVVCVHEIWDWTYIDVAFSTFDAAEKYIEGKSNEICQYSISKVELRHA